jgi:hypothetical protein
MRKLLFVASAIGQANAEAWLCLVVAVGCVGGWRGGVISRTVGMMIKRSRNINHHQTCTYIQILIWLHLLKDINNCEHNNLLLPTGL